MKSDIQIAQEAAIMPINKVAAKIGISEEHLEYYGKYKAKISDSLFEETKNRPNGKLVLVTAINPTPAGEGKTTTTIGLAQALNLMNCNTIAALREPSLGPCMGVKGGAAGGGYAQVLPMEDINLHFTGDIHAMTTAHNLISALLDNHIQQGNKLGIDPRRIVWRRAMDMNDRALRHIIVGLGGKPDGMPREDGFMITVASEIMAILCLSDSIDDLKRRISKIIVAYNFVGTPVTAGDLKATGAAAALLKDAIKPNLVQTLENTPVFIHGGPFANIAHGCNSVRATKIALKLADVVVTEAGFGADLGAEKFFDIKCRKAGLSPDCVVLVASVRSLRYNGGVKKAELNAPNVDAVKKGLVNIGKHIENIRKYGVPIVVTLNHFMTDTDEEIALVKNLCKEEGASFALSDVWANGGEGGKELGAEVLNALKKPSEFNLLYRDELSVKEKIETVCKEIYGAGNVNFSAVAMSELNKIKKFGLDNLPVCIAKTQYSLSDNPLMLGRPEGFDVNVRELRISAGAGFVVVLLGDIMLMPGLPETPAAETIDIDNNGSISGLF